MARHSTNGEHNAQRSPTRNGCRSGICGERVGPMDLPGYAGRNRTDHPFRKIENCSVEPRAGLSKATGKSVHHPLWLNCERPSAEHAKPGSAAKQIHRAVMRNCERPGAEHGKPDSEAKRIDRPRPKTDRLPVEIVALRLGPNQFPRVKARMDRSAFLVVVSWHRETYANLYCLRGLCGVPSRRELAL
jgi:hypothetical protein